MKTPSKPIQQLEMMLDIMKEDMKKRGDVIVCFMMHRTGGSYDNPDMQIHTRRIEMNANDVDRVMFDRYTQADTNNLIGVKT